MNGKGSKRRPQQVDDALVAENWTRAFGKKASYEEAPTLNDEMQQHQDKHLPWFLKEQAE
ncbi:MAG TPA: hypothetical protein ENI26_02025 [Methylophaga aminisulfidivorans]|uniref:Uncharacterized protein n=1 Tax=Methylophaga aminisulfidivorans TaxID=230105 RepID=A0A7C2AFN8_9GAMM|nr:hypothetical protein [Methylophaga aminisulfidivorans]